LKKINPPPGKTNKGKTQKAAKPKGKKIKPKWKNHTPGKTTSLF
jgi:hypothetical protein